MQAPSSPVLGRPESHARALVKAVTWRVLGSLDTFLWGWLITGHPGEAGAIATSETFTKIGLYYVHERVWRLLKWSPNARSRSLVKAVTWRMVGSLDTFLLSLLFTGSGKLAISIASVEALTKVGVFYLHERAWRRIAWGRFDISDGQAAEGSAPPPPAPQSQSQPPLQPQPAFARETETERP